MADLKDLFKKVQELAREMFLALPKQEVLGIQNLYEQVWNASMDSEEWMWLIELYVDESNGSISALFAKNGKLYLSPVTVADSGATLGDMTEVKTVFEPVKNQFTVKQMKDGTDRWFLVASSTVLNRMGYFNSQELFDNLIKHSVDSGKYPYLSFYHVGEVMNMGITDWVGREENILLASGTFNDSMEAQLMKESIKKDPDYWGSSISFWPLAQRKAVISEGIELPVYTDGEFDEISMLAEPDACCLMTAAVAQRKVKQGMDPRMKAALEKLADGDETKLADLIAKVDGANEQIRTEGLLHQSVTTEVVVPDPAQTPVTEPVVETASAQQDLVLDDTLTTRIVEQLAIHPTIQHIMSANDEKIGAIESGIAELRVQFTEITEYMHKHDQRLQAIEKPVQAQVQDTINNLSRNQLKPKIVYRPSEQVAQTAHEPQLQEEKALSEIAEDTLSKIKS